MWTATTPTQAQSSSASRSPETAIFERLLEIPSTYELGLEFSDEVSSEQAVITDEDAALYTSTLPNFWMSRNHLPTLWRTANNLPPLRVESYRLIRRWTAFRSKTAASTIVDFQVDPQYWNQLNYYQRYAVLRHLGTTAMSYGLQARIYNSVSLAGVYACDYSRDPRLANALQNPVEIPDLDDLDCTASVGPFVNYRSPEFGEDLFAPP